MVIISIFIIHLSNNINTDLEENAKQYYKSSISEGRFDSLVVVTVLTAGDAMAHLPQTNAAYDTAKGQYCYVDVFKYIKPVVSSFDLSIINLETTLAGKPYRGYPQFSAPDNYAADLYNTGFNFFCCANNHSVDRFNRGILRTLKVLDSLEIRHTGIFKNPEHREKEYPALIDIKGVRIAILNATYGTNGLFPRDPVSVNMIEKDEIAMDIAKANQKNPDVIIAVMHWGGEYLRYPDNYQKSIAKFLTDNGVDIIVGHHPHVLQPVEWIKGQVNDSKKEIPVIWSLGNFFSNQRQRYRDGGMFVNFDIILNISSGETYIDNLSWYPFWVRKQYDPVSYTIIPSELRDSLINHYSFDEKSLRVFDRFTSDSRLHIGKNRVVAEYFHYN